MILNNEFIHLFNLYLSLRTMLLLTNIDVNTLDFKFYRIIFLALSLKGKIFSEENI